MPFVQRHSLFLLPYPLKSYVW